MAQKTSTSSSKIVNLTTYAIMSKNCQNSIKWLSILTKVWSIGFNGSMTVSSENRVEIRDPQGGTIRDGPRPRRPRMRTFRTRKRTRTRTSEMRIFWTRTARTRNSEDVNFGNFRNVQGRQGRRRPAEAYSKLKINMILNWDIINAYIYSIS